MSKVNPKVLALKLVATEKGFHVLPLPNDIWELTRDGKVKTLFCLDSALNWAHSAD